MKETSIAILDYGVGNVKSITNGFRKVGVRNILTNDPAKIMAADGCILPGVGAFAFGMKSLARHKLVDTIHAFAESGKPLMGICLGMQLLLEESDEFGVTKGLGLIPGRVEKMQCPTDSTIRLPHVCWNHIYEPNTQVWDNSVLETTDKNEDVYFIHSFIAKPTDPANVLCMTQYESIEFCSGVKKANIMGVQFHPEKSGRAGLNILRSFAKLCDGELV